MLVNNVELYLCLLLRQNSYCLRFFNGVRFPFLSLKTRHESLGYVVCSRSYGRRGSLLFLGHHFLGIQKSHWSTRGVFEQLGRMFVKKKSYQRHYANRFCFYQFIHSEYYKSFLNVDKDPALREMCRHNLYSQGFDMWHEWFYSMDVELFWNLTHWLENNSMEVHDTVRFRQDLQTARSVAYLNAMSNYYCSPDYETFTGELQKKKVYKKWVMQVGSKTFKK